uniref:Reverse transcriptase domain-containing protein n=1 Tax=Tanacetum cinerariifolium TaxID=118510 RepID=A0A6L2M761_TANCI|nr:reverse transcriptase domain-containing protein [Tanacetum cinerariifolium]
MVAAKDEQQGGDEAPWWPRKGVEVVIPSHVGSYDRKGDPDNYIHLFETRFVCKNREKEKSLEPLSPDLPTTYKGLTEKTYTWIKVKEVATNGALNDHREGFDRYIGQTMAIGKKLPTNVKRKLQDLLRSNTNIFTWTYANMIGISRTIMVEGKPFNIEHGLNKHKHIEPVKQKKRSLAPYQNEAICKEVEELMKADILREVKYQTWVSNLVMVKKDNGKWKMCIDFIDVNKACPKDYYPLPEDNQKIESLSKFGLKFFLDAYKGYHQIQMAKGDEEKMDFFTKKGLGILISFTLVYHPQANGEVEVTNRYIVKGIERILRKNHQGWVYELPHVLWAHIITPKSNNRETSFSLTYGFEAIVPIEISVETKRVKEFKAKLNEKRHREDLDIFKERREIASIREAYYKQKMERYYNKHGRICLNFIFLIPRSGGIRYVLYYIRVKEDRKPRRCGESFCGLHWMPEKHACKFDFKAAGRVVIEKHNPLCVADKLEGRICLNFIFLIPCFGGIRRTKVNLEKNVLTWSPKAKSCPCGQS